MSVAPLPAPPPPSPRRRSGGFAFGLSLALNVLLLAVVAVVICGALFFGGGSDDGLVERLYAGKATAKDKVAIVRIEGVIFEGALGYVHRQLDQAAKDPDVKAVVLRINSPGGSITASDELHHRLTELRDGNPLKKTPAKPLVVSMGSMATSGGYYIAMPASTLFAERTTLTGSIGVFAAFPDLTKLSDKIGIGMRVIKAGEVKDSGSPFAEMSPKERDLWQQLIDHAYVQFIEVVEAGRPQLKGKLQEDIVIDETLPVRNEKGMQRQRKLTRYRADGGIFTADIARTYGLIDRLGFLDDAVAAAKATAGLGDETKVIMYDAPQTLLRSLLGVRSPEPASTLDLSRWESAATPRLWYLAPQAEVAGWLKCVGN